MGQRQQIAIARAIVKDSPMVILDEATSSVDTRTEKRIQQTMDMMTGGRTSFVIAHRLSTVRNADRILVMVGGEIVESGTHEELLELGGYYRTLHDAQFEETERGYKHIQTIACLYPTFPAVDAIGTTRHQDGDDHES